MQSDKLLSIVLPSFNEENNVPRAAETVAGLLTEAAIPFEILFVDDGSKDGTWQAITEAARLDSRVRGVRFSRNFGKEAAIMAGLKEAKGACCAVMDCDLQHPPEKLLEMYALWQEGYQVIEAVKIDRGEEGPLYKLAAKLFYGIMSHTMKMDFTRASDFKLLDRCAVDALTELKEKDAFFRALSSWIGFRTTTVEFAVQPRREGESKWRVRNLLRYALSNIASFTTAPLQLVTILGVIVFLFSVLLGIQSLYGKLAGHALPGFTTVILLILFIGSMLMICLGIIGYYIAKIYEEIRQRPRYLVAERTEQTRA